MRRSILATALLACPLFIGSPAFATNVALTTTAERSGFKQTGRYDEVILQDEPMLTMYDAAAMSPRDVSVTLPVEAAHVAQG